MTDPVSLALAPPDDKVRMIVVIPARNEAEQIEPTLRALTNQVDNNGKILSLNCFEIIVLANNCSDITADVVRQFIRKLDSCLSVHLVERTFRLKQAHVGTARRWLMDLACTRLEAVGQPRGLIASTDADTRVARNWVSSNLTEVDSGADAVAGLIQVDPRGLRRLGEMVRRAYWQDRIHRRLLVELEAIIDLNPLDVFPRHDFHGGASLAITAEMYRRVGGLPPLPSWEDVALAEALWREDARFVHSPQVWVRTSARQAGRAIGGQSYALERWSTQATIWVKDIRQVEAELMKRHRLRRFFAAKQSECSTSWRPDLSEVLDVAQVLRIDPDKLTRLMTNLPTFGRWLEAVARLQAIELDPGETGKVPIAEAIVDLRSRLRELKGLSPL